MFWINLLRIALVVCIKYLVLGCYCCVEPIQNYGGTVEFWSHRCHWNAWWKRCQPVVGSSRPDRRIPSSSVCAFKCSCAFRHRSAVFYMFSCSLLPHSTLLSDVLHKCVILFNFDYCYYSKWIWLLDGNTPSVCPSKSFMFTPPPLDCYSPCSVE